MPAPTCGLCVSASVGAGDIFKQGIGGGASKAADTLSQYWIKRAEQYHPVIDIGAGNAVAIFFVITSVLLVPKRSVQILDVTDPAAVYQVDNVPAGRPRRSESEAAPAGGGRSASHLVTTLISTLKNCGQAGLKPLAPFSQNPSRPETPSAH